VLPPFFMTQSFFRDTLEPKRKKNKTLSLLKFVALYTFLTFVWRGVLAWVTAFALTILVPSLPIWPLFGLIYAVSFFLPNP